MAFKKGIRMGYVLEHRLVMAEHLKRCLHSWEIVHHRNGIRHDNRLDNLQIVTELGHKALTLLENRVKQLEQRVLILEAENVALKAQNAGLI
ncbi:MAG: HNH endonuclease [Gammaproteobacteria bacterium]|nr:HNH endonuclease [Gammaproteobacteria bacterium]